MVDRLNNSTGVLAALKHLQASTRDLSSAENRLSSGLRVATARDDATSYHSAAVMRGQGSALNVVAMSLGRAESISETAIAAAEQVSKLLIEMQKTATAAMGEDLSLDQREAFMLQFKNQQAQLAQFVNSASFDDANILNGSKPLGISFVADPEGDATLMLTGRNFLPGGPIVTVGADHDLHSTTNAQAARDAVAESIRNVGDRLTEMVGEHKRIEAQKGFVSKLADALAAGVGRMVDTDLAMESALIQALQIKQELGAQSVGIANNAPHTLLTLFRG